jgi:hypothetical protein
MEKDFVVVLNLTLLTCKKKKKSPCGLGIFPFILLKIWKTKIP